MVIPLNERTIQIVRHLIFIGTGIFVCVYALFIFYWGSHTRYAGLHPFPGRDGILEILAIDPESPADKMGLKPGDQILNVDGIDFLNPVTWFLFAWQSKDREKIQVTYKRGTTVISKELYSAPPVFPTYTFIGVLLCFSAMALCFPVYLKRPFDPAVRFFFLGGCVTGFGHVLFYDVSAVVINPIGFISALSLFGTPMFLHASFIIPDKKRIAKKHPVILFLIYIPMLVWILTGMLIYGKIILLYLQGNTGPVPGILSQTIFLTKWLMVLMLFYLTATLGGATHTYFTTKNQEIKKQFKWLVWGASISLFMGYIGCVSFFRDDQFIPLYFSVGGSFPVIWIVGIVLSFFAAALSIYKYRLMEIDTIIHHSLAYTLVSGLSLILYFLIFAVLSRFFEMVSGKSTGAVYAISILMVAFIFRPMLTQIEQKIDKLFFREKYELHNAVEVLIQALTAIRDTKMIFQNVFQTVAKTIHVQSGVLFLIDESGETLTQIYSLSDDVKGERKFEIPIAIAHPLVLHLKAIKKGLTCYQVREGKTPRKNRETFIQLFQETQMEIFLPLIFENRLLGIIGFGEKKSGDLYSSHDVGMLTILAHQAAVAMENARAYHQIKQLNTEMEEKVDQIEQQYDEILVLQKQMLNENKYLREELRQQCHFEEIIGSSNQMQQVLDMVEKVAPTTTTVLIRGESGTGKELIARAIHFNSPREKKPFVKVNCAAIPANLLESELFGHERGAFTGAITQKQGKFEMASGGTLFLDEIGDLEPDLQVKLLRVLQEKEFERVGGTKTITADVRIISATNRNIESAISRNSFREDLFFRLNVITITLPPLRSRNGDIRELVIHFIKMFRDRLNKPVKNIDPDAMNILKSYPWPGNVRELANIIERAMVLGEGDTLSAKDLPQNLVSSVSSSAGMDALLLADGNSLAHEVKQFEYKLITQAMEKANGNISEASRILGLKRSTLNSKLQKYSSAT